VPRNRSVAEGYHQLTKYRQETLHARPGLDWSTQPEQYKDIVSSRRLSLRALERRAKPEDPEHELARLARLLFYCNGVTGVIPYQDGSSQHLRASPSAGALYPTEIYVALRDFPGIESGLYNYQARSHELVMLWDGDQIGPIGEACGNHPAFADARICAVMTGVYWRSAWRYQERGYRRVLLDTGHVLSNMLAYAPHEGYGAHALPAFKDDALNGLFFFDNAVEAALLCVPLTEECGEVPPAPLWSSPRGAGDDLEAKTILGEADLRHSSTVRLHRASCCDDARVVTPATPRATPSGPVIALPPQATLEEKIPSAIVERRSARGFTGEPISLDDLAGALAYAFQQHCPTRQAGMLRADLIVHKVDGLEAGLYAVEGDGSALLQRSEGSLREACFSASLDQQIARDCAAILCFWAPATASVGAWGDRAYRYLHIDAGVLGERVQLAAGALGYGACGIAGFLDDEAAAIVRADTGDFVLYLVTLGRV